MEGHGLKELTPWMHRGKMIHLRPTTLAELASLYGVSKPTLRKWIKPFAKELGERIGYKYSIRQVQLILQKLSMPEDLDAYKKMD